MEYGQKWGEQKEKLFWKKQVGWQKGRLRETANGPAYGWMDVPAMPMVRGRQSERQDGFRRPAGRVRGCGVGEPTVKSARCSYVLRELTAS